MNRFTGVFRLVYRIGQDWVSKESTFFNFNVQTRQVLINDAACAQVNVAHFGVAHLAVRQTHFQTGCVDQGMRTFCPQSIHHRGFGV
ncbi:Uncharacterised protein [Salmonella enterica subsp. enterica serovar Bovismorbificans]|uniref:Uncharacterized protein n=1 Tax=Salmonella enterica subsp. enterica serovar Bovismorbificans TaxID=58097 RepID=A0A655CV74_SALET|nr:Uncharacterised protein [Salmonella enterica subsp. enterica serovar Bovismorbificans]CNU31651.1 Uncharacterised protein [Salmonella enterica subsp. enterica serovar Bovismorbificans]CPR57994.1 Uncharacterised protein [Salmonella enterica subsp. enterica serovar Bovismorbificans]